MGVTPRSRLTYHGTAWDYHYWVQNLDGSVPVASTKVRSSNGYSRRSLLISDGHRQPYPKGGGGPFYSTFYNAQRKSPPMHVEAPYQPDVAVMIHAGIPNVGGTNRSLPDIGFRSWEDEQKELLPWGVLGWDRANPAKPVQSLGQFVGELRQLPSVPFKNVVQAMSSGGGVAKLRRAIGSEYLNFDFGIKPFVNDLRDFLFGQEELDKAMAALANGAKTGIRRRRTLRDRPKILSVESDTDESTGYMHLPGGPETRTGRTVITWSHTRIWFVAKFRYNLPDYTTPEGFSKLRNYLQGIPVNGSGALNLLWDLTPWSWMADWFGNMGSNLQNLAAEEAVQLTADYAYIMRTESLRQISINWGYNLACGFQTVVWESERTTKSRMEASPFGFGLTLGDLSGSQMATLGALGLSTRRL